MQKDLTRTIAELSLEQREALVSKLGYRIAGSGTPPSPPAYYTVKGGQTLTPAQLSEFLSQRLPAYMVPACLTPLERFPRTPGGKIDVTRLPRPEAPVKKAPPPAAPHGAEDNYEERLTALWAEILDTAGDVIGGRDNFFQLGGHSLKATVLIARIREEFGVKVGMERIFETPTIEGLAAFIRTAESHRRHRIPPAEEKEYYPLSIPQKRFYILQQTEPNGTGFNTPTIFLVEGTLDREKMQRVFEHLVLRHESFRTSFLMKEGEPVQRIHPEVSFQLEEYRGPGTPEAAVENFIRPFDLSRAPLLRAGVKETGPGEYLFMMDMHHIICDGVSSGILLDDFRALYNGETPAPPAVRYRDFAQWQNSPRRETVTRRRREYWFRRFSGNLPAPALPLDFPRPEVRDRRGGVVDFEIDTAKTSELKRFAVEQGVSLYMLLLAAYTLLLSKLTGGEDIVVGTAAAGRDHAGLEPVIGLFFNTLALRSFPSAGKPFGQFLQEIKEISLSAFENQDYGFEQLVSELAAEGIITRETGRNPLFDTMFALQNFDIPGAMVPRPGIPGLKLKPYRYSHGTAKFDLLMDGAEIDGRMLMNLEYAEALFKHTTVESFTRHYLEILDQVLGNFNITPAEITLSRHSTDAESKFGTDDFTDFDF